MWPILVCWWCCVQSWKARFALCWRTSPTLRTARSWQWHCPPCRSAWPGQWASSPLPASPRTDTQCLSLPDRLSHSSLRPSTTLGTRPFRVSTVKTGKESFFCFFFLYFLPSKLGILTRAHTHIRHGNKQGWGRLLAVGKRTSNFSHCFFTTIWAIFISRSNSSDSNSTVKTVVPFRLANKNFPQQLRNKLTFMKRVSGSHVTPNGLSSTSPILRLMSSFELTLGRPSDGCVITPPAFKMRSFSLGSVGLWSWVSRTTLPDLQSKK